MTEQIIDRVNVKECKYYYNGKCVRYEDFVEADYANDYSVKCICEEENTLGTYDICDYQQLKAKEQECEELNKIINEAKSSRLDLQSFLVCEALGEEYEPQIDQLKAENEELIRRITKIFACLIKANRTNRIVDTLWVDNITTLWDYIAQTLGIEVDPVQIEEQILQKISEVENDNVEGE